MRRLTIAIALLLAAPAAAAPPPVKEAWDRSKPRVSAAQVRLNPVPGRPSAGYLTIEGGGQPDRLVTATSTAPGVRIELHSMSMTGDVMKMAKLDALPVPAGGTVALAPGGNHLMIFGLTGTPASLPLTLGFGSGARVTVTADVKPVGMDPHAGH
ncbi:MAG: copper chaperone PCu(A)C [Polymorphobacter sp.]